MPEQRHTTTLDIRVDDREVQQLAESLDRTFSTKVIDKFTEGLEKQSRAFTTLIHQQKELAKELGAVSKALKDAARGDNGPGMVQRVGEQAAGTAIGHKLYDMMKELPHQMMGAVRGELTTSLMKAVPGVGEAAAEIVEGARQYYQMQVAYAGQRAGAFGKTGLGVGSMDSASRALGERFGVMPEEVPGLLSSISQQTGLTGRDLQGAAPTALGLGRIAGVDQAGSVVGAAGSVGGQMNAARATSLMKDTLSAAIVSGFQESRFDQYFQSLATFTEQMRNQGMMMDPESINALIRGFGASNAETLRGMGAIGFAQNALGGIQKGMRGRGIAAAILMKATGVTEGRNFFEAQEDLENNPAQYFADVVKLIRQNTSNISDQHTRAGFVRNIWEQAGFGNISMSRARDILEMDPDKLKNEFFQPEGENQATDKFMKKRRASFEGTVSPLRFEASKRMEEIEMGQRPEIRKLVQVVHETDLQAVAAILPPLAEAVSGVIEHAVELVSKWKDILGSGESSPRGPARKAALGGDMPDPLTGLPTLPEEDAVEHDANAREFGPGVAALIQAEKNKAREAFAQHEIKMGRGKAFAEGGDPLKGKNIKAIGHGRSGPEKVAEGGRMIEAGSRLIQEGAADLVMNPMTVASEGDLVGGH